MANGIVVWRVLRQYSKSEGKTVQMDALALSETKVPKR